MTTAIADDLSASQRGTGVFEAALDLASPDLYERIAFRLLELPVEATEREVERRRDLMEKAARSQLAAPPGPARMCPHAQPPDDHAVREAAHALQDAERRLAHEFFWFWPLQPGSAAPDLALGHLAQGKVKAACEAWGLGQAQPAVRPACKHNLALYYHLSALDLERELLDAAADATASGLSAVESKATLHWQFAMQYWKDCAADEALWSRVSARIRVIDDRSLTTGAARRLQRSLPVALTMIDARLAMRALDRGQPAQAQRHAARIHASKLDAAGVEEGLRRALEPVRTRLKSLCDDAKHNARADRAHADAVTDRLLVQAAPLLAVLDHLLPESHAARQGDHDQVAQAAMACQIEFGNLTRNYRRCLELSNRIVPVAATATVRAEMVRNRDIDARDLEAGICWFCGKNDRDQSCTVEVAMHGEVETIAEPDGGTRTRWKHLEVYVPRCAVCRDEEKAVAQGNEAALLLGLLAGLVVGTLIWHFIDSGLGVAAGIGTYAVVHLALMAKAAKRARAITKRPRDDFPGIKKRKADGWAFGDKPPGVQ